MVDTRGTANAPKPSVRSETNVTDAKRRMLTEEGMDDANPSLSVMFKSRNETVQLRILVTALDDGN